MGGNSIASSEIPFSFLQYDSPTNKIRSRLVKGVSQKGGPTVTKRDIITPESWGWLSSDGGRGRIENVRVLKMEIRW